MTLEKLVIGILRVLGKPRPTLPSWVTSSDKAYVCRAADTAVVA
jgi:hypothetical protein